MKNKLLLLCMLITGIANAQTNELPLMGFRFIYSVATIEDANSYYFMTSITNAVQIPSTYVGSAYTLHKCNKITHAVERSIFLVGDTLQRDSVISYPPSISTISAGRICLTYSKLLMIDPTATGFQKYGSALYYQELDTALNVVVPEKQLFVAGPHERFIYCLPIAIAATLSKRVVLYQLTDTLRNQYGTLSKYFLLDAQGNVLKHDTVDLKPNILPTQITEHYASECVVTPTGGFMIGGAGLLSSTNFSSALVSYDSNMNFIDTFTLRPDPFTPAWPGAYNFTFPNMLMLPSGSIITGGPYQGTSTNGNYYSSAAISKSGSAATGYYFAPPVVTPYKDGSDGAHTMRGRYNIVYNTYDNRVYYADMTHATFECTGTSNYAEVICADTNLNIMWRKYIFSGDHACNFVYHVIRCDGRAGVLIEGDDRYDDTTKSYSFLYHIDSSSTTGVTNSPITIRDRFAVYPNPAKDHIIVDDFLGKLAEVSITNMQGQVIYHNAASGNKLQVSVAQYPAGLYMVRCRSTDNEWYSTKVIKE